MAGNPTVQDVLRQFYPRYLEKYTPNARQTKTVSHILNCKTGAYGVNVSRCSQCGGAGDRLPGGERLTGEDILFIKARGYLKTVT